MVVTGGAGFLGREIVRQLLARGFEDVRVLDREPWQGATGPVRGFVRDLCRDDLTDALQGAALVLHGAACQYHSPLARSTYGLPFFEVNVEGTRRLLTKAADLGVPRFVLVSTNMVYGLPEYLPVGETHRRRPIGPYGQSKLIAERLVQGAESWGLRTSIVRPGLLVGPGRLGVLGRVFSWITAQRPVWLIGDGENRYELIHVSDCARLVIEAGLAEVGGIYNCGARAVPTMRGWVEAVIAEAGSRSRVVGLPAGPLKGLFRTLDAARISPLRADQYLIADRDYYLDTRRAQKNLGWQPEHDGISAVLDSFRWYRARLGGGAAAGRA